MESKATPPNPPNVICPHCKHQFYEPRVTYLARVICPQCLGIAQTMAPPNKPNSTARGQHEKRTPHEHS